MTKAAISSAVVAAGLLVLGTSAQAQTASDLGNPTGSGDGSVLAQSPALGGKAAGEDAERSIDRTFRGKRTVVADNQEQATDLGNPSGSGDGGVLAQSPALGGKANGKSVVQLEDRALRLKSTN